MKTRLFLALVLFLLCVAGGAQTFSVDCSATSSTVASPMLYGMNVARWDKSLFPTSSSQMLLDADRDAIAKLRDLKPGFLKYPGGNDADSYIWNSPRNPSREMDTDEFVWLCKTCDCPGFITVNFTESPHLAALWLHYIDTQFGRDGRIAVSGAVPYWEVGDEVWGPWAKSHTTGASYGKKFREFVTGMRAIDPRVKFAANLALASSDTTWTRQAIAALGDSFQIVTMTFFPLSPPNENDADLLATADQYRVMFRKLRSVVADARKAAPPLQYCLVGFNSTSTKPGPQTVEMVNAVFMAQMYAAMAEVGTDMACWWAFHNEWKPRGGDYGVLSSDGKNTPNFTYWVMKLLSHNFVGPLVSVGRDKGVEFYATQPGQTSTTLLIINPRTTASEPVSIGVKGCRPESGTLAIDTVDSSSLGIRHTPLAVSKTPGQIEVGPLPPYSVSVVSVPR